MRQKTTRPGQPEWLCALQKGHRKRNTSVLPRSASQKGELQSRPGKSTAQTMFMATHWRRYGGQQNENTNKRAHQCEMSTQDAWARRPANHTNHRQRTTCSGRVDHTRTERASFEEIHGSKRTELASILIGALPISTLIARFMSQPLRFQY